MKKEAILKQLSTPKTKSYSYAIIFFLIFSFFAYFIIRPNLISVFESKGKIEGLQKDNLRYQREIDKIIEIQTILEQHRDEFVYLSDAITTKPKVNKVLSDIYGAAIENKLEPDRIDVSDVNLKEKGIEGKLKAFTVTVDTTGNFEDGVAFLKKIYEQRRLKLLTNGGIGKVETEEEASASANSSLKLKLEIEGFYL